MIHFKVFEVVNKDLIENLNNIKNNKSFYVFQLPEWIDAVLNNSNKSNKLKFVFVYNSSDIILVAPLQIKKVFGCKELCWVSSDIIDYNGAIISKHFNFEDNNFKEIWKKIIKDLSNECDLVYLNKNPEFILSKSNPLLDSKYKHYQKSYQLNLNKFDYDNFYNNKNNNKSKQTDRRKKKKLDEGDDLVCSYEKISLYNFYLIEELIIEKMSSYLGKKEKTFNYKNIINQYKEIVSRNNSDCEFNLSILKKNNVKISSILGVMCSEIYYYLIPVTHNTEYKKLSPGRFHIINLINWSIKNNIQQIDFTPGDETYKINWSNNDFKMFYYIKPLSLKGIIRYFFLNFYYKLRKNNFLKKIYHYIQYEI
jgi:CelD/BcsL family acetyltransferase involved in cellulose biosynthesis